MPGTYEQPWAIKKVGLNRARPRCGPCGLRHAAEYQYEPAGSIVDAVEPRRVLFSGPPIVPARLRASLVRGGHRRLRPVGTGHVGP